MKLTVLLTFCLCLLHLLAAPVTVEPSKSVILLPPKHSRMLLDAANDLQLHFELITGVKVPIKTGTVPQDGVYTFLIGTHAPGTDREFAVEESRWVIGEKAAYLFGDDKFARRGSEFAVMNFLERQLGVVWIEPGNDGIVYTPSPVLKLQSGSYKWVSPMLIRIVHLHNSKNGAPAGLEQFNFTDQEHKLRFHDDRRWQRRMLMCHRTDLFLTGHAFTKWWAKYGKDHPEYFALNKQGRRAPEVAGRNANDPIATSSGAKTIKFCLSNPGLVKQVLAEYYAQNPRPTYINLCENDNAGGYCRCEGCIALDPVKNQNMDDANSHLTDRYLHFVNAVAREVAKDGTLVITYAYNETKNPPLREKLEPNVLLSTVPTMLDVKELDDYYAKWRERGMTKFLFRPNYHWVTMHTGIPMGMEKLFYDLLNTAIKYGAIGGIFDSAQCHWSLNGIFDYVLHHKLGHPEKTFEELENEYCSAYGAAAEDIKEYFRYFRNEIFTKRLQPNIAELTELGGYGNFAKGVIRSLDKYYSLSDFDKTDAILARAAKRKLTPVEARRVKRLQLANEHSRLLFNAVTAQGDERIPASVALLNWRIAHRGEKDVKLNFLNLFRSESTAGCTAIDSALVLREFAKPYIETPSLWYALTDEKDAGIAEKWAALPMSEIRKKGELLPVDSPWEKISSLHTAISPEFKKKMQSYDGLVWYFQQLNIPDDWRGKEVYLCFGAVDEECEVYVNGKKAGEHLMIKPTDWRTPFAIRIDQHIDWQKSCQNIAVRVKDSSGQGGIWKRVWLVHK